MYVPFYVITPEKGKWVIGGLKNIAIILNLNSMNLMKIIMIIIESDIW